MGQKTTRAILFIVGYLFNFIYKKYVSVYIGHFPRILHNCPDQLLGNVLVIHYFHEKYLRGSTYLI